MATTVVWFRNDLRVHDHQPLIDACQTAGPQGEVVLLYVIDPRFFAKTSFGFERTGVFRRQFLRESIEDLSRRIAQIGGSLQLLVGHPEVVLPRVCSQCHVSSVHCHDEVATEESIIEARVADALAATGVQFKSSPPPRLYAMDDFPFELEETPEVFSKFRRKVEKKCVPRPPVKCPDVIPSVSEASGSMIDSVPIEKVDVLAGSWQADDRSVMPFRGGETAALERIEDYFWRTDQLKVYKETRNGMLHANDSSKLSPWLALGCVSPRYIYQEVCRYESERVKNDSTYWLIFELLWRDYFSIMVEKHGANVFQVGGMRQESLPWQLDRKRFDIWATGQTGFPLIDANMRELATTGFMSNRGRQNVASFLTKNLGIEWRMGAEWFESLLIDYDPCSNYGNWNYVAGVGNDARQFRWFNTLKQSKDYDPQGEYVRHWLPELATVPLEDVHQPWGMTMDQQTQSGCVIGVDYPRPMVDLFQSAEANRQKFEVGN